MVTSLGNSLEFAGWRERKLLARALRRLYTRPVPRRPPPSWMPFAQGASGRRFPTVPAHTLKLSPQPQLDFTFGLLNLKAAFRPSRA